MEGKPTVLVSACLTGEPCRYDGTGCARPEVTRLARRGEAVPGCPEVLGGLGIPRPAAEIVGGDGRDVLSGRAVVLTREGADVTAAFVDGALAFVDLAEASGCRRAILKSRSPSCGVNTIFNGTFSGTIMTGAGVATAALRAAGIRVDEIS